MQDRNREPAAPEGQPRPENREGQNQSAPAQSEGGQPGQDDDLAGMEGQESFRGGQQGQPEKRSDSDGEHGGNR